MKKATLLVLSVMTMLSLPSTAAVTSGQKNNVNLNDSSRVYDLDEVLVVSHPKEVFRLRQQPLSSSTFTGKQIKSLGVRDLPELSNYIPSFVMPNYGSRYTSSMYIRGIGSRINSPAAGLYIDGLPIMSKSMYNFHIYQLAGIDIMRGPQGTLYGQNAEGGFVRMYTPNPINYQGTDVNLSIGSRFYRNVELSHYMKMNDQLAFSFAGFYNGHNGFFKNQTTGKYADRINEAGGKARMIVRPAERWNVDLIADYQYVDQNGFPYGQLDVETGKTSEPAMNRESSYRRHFLNTGLNLTYKGNLLDVNSTTAYQYLNDHMLLDQDFLAQDFMHLKENQIQNSFIQEISFRTNRPRFWNAAGGVFFSKVWLKTDGPVFFDADMTTPMQQMVQSMMYQGILKGMTEKMIAGGTPAAMAENIAKGIMEKQGGVAVTDLKMGAPGIYRTPCMNLGVFHESNFNLTDRLTATLGLRYDFSHADIDYASSAYLSMSAKVMGVEATRKLNTILKNKADDNYNQLLPKFGLTYNFSKEIGNIYATVSKGYRAGGFNFQMFSDILSYELQANSRSIMKGDLNLEHSENDYKRVNKTIAYQPETSWNYEAGAHLNFSDYAVQLDLAAYYMQVTNQQLSVMAGNYGFGRMMVNAGKSYSCGVEMSLRGSALSNHLNWNLTYAFTHATFKEYTDSMMVKGERVPLDYKGKKVPFVPEHMFSASADYRIDFTNNFIHGMTFGANVYGMGKIQWDEANSISQDFYAVLGAHIDADLGFTQISLWGRNLSDTKYNTFAVKSGATGKPMTFAQPGNPLQFGVDLRFHF